VEEDRMVVPIDLRDETDGKDALILMDRLLIGVAIMML